MAIKKEATPPVAPIRVLVLTKTVGSYTDGKGVKYIAGMEYPLTKTNAHLLQVTLRATGIPVFQEQAAKKSTRGAKTEALDENDGTDLSTDFNDDDQVVTV